MKPVGFDNTMLSILLNPNGRIPHDESNRPLVMPKRRAEYLIEGLARSRQKIIIPTPAVAELLTAIGPDAQQYFDIIARSRLFEVASFDSRCAIELAFLNRDVFASGDPKNRDGNCPGLRPGVCGNLGADLRVPGSLVADFD